MVRTPTALLWTATLLIALAGCETASLDETASRAVPASAPYDGDGDGDDRADRGCQLILRTVAPRDDGHGGQVIHVIDGVAARVWDGALDVAFDAEAAGRVPAVIYQRADGGWWEVPATPAGDGADGFARYTFTLDEHTVGELAAMDDPASGPLRLIPLLRGPDADRWFDHNRLPGALDSYELGPSNAWSVVDDGVDCDGGPDAPRATLRFDTGWTEQQHGTVVAGGQLTVDYDPYRLPECFGDSYMGMATFSVWGYGVFTPGGQTFDGSVMACDDPRCTLPRRQPLRVDVPADATGVELWFATAGRACATHWDSNFGANYGFAVEPAPDAVAWAGDWGHAISRGFDQRVDGVPEPLWIDSWALTRAEYRYVDAEVYVPGLTEDEDARHAQLLARARVRRDGGAPAVHWLRPAGRDCNNLRFAYDLSAEDLIYTPWDRFELWFEFSTDGLDWWRIGLDEGPDGFAPRTVARDDDWCPDGYWGAWCD